MRVSMRLTTIILLIAMGLTGLSLSTTSHVAAQAAPVQYILVGSGGSLPANLDALVASVGGQLVGELDEIGVAIAQSADPNFVNAMASVSGLQGVAADRPIALALPGQGDTTVVESLDGTSAPPTTVDTTNLDLTSIDLSSLDATSEAIAPGGINPAQAKFFLAQWNLRDIGAPATWSAGFMGSSSVKVAVVDTGIDYTQQELVGQVDMTLSRSFFTEPLPKGAAPFLDVHGHGTHIAGIIAAKGLSVAGVAPRVTLLAIKVAGRSGFATYASIIAAIKYAADVGANIINMSFGDDLAKGGRDNALLMAALNNAVNYAYGKGALLVASAGNSGIDWDRRICETHDALGNLIVLNCPTGKIPSNLTLWNAMKVPAQLPHVLAVSATGPQFQLSMKAMGVVPNGANPEQIYSDHGMSIINFAAPGGSVTPFRCLPVFASATGPMIACNLLPPLLNGNPDPNGMAADSILSACARFTPFPPGKPNCTSGRANIFMVGTSMAAAHVSGAAALVDSAAGGMLTPDQITQMLMQSADQFGQPGKDPWYGYGRINVYRAVTGN